MGKGKGGGGGGNRTGPERRGKEREVEMGKGESLADGAGCRPSSGPWPGKSGKGAISGTRTWLSRGRGPYLEADNLGIQV